ncbi:MAG TPA: response regulator [Terriglobales bacterium]|nr:response regulator [Terriglobales bacterium]
MDEKPSILFVDDEPGIRLTLGQILSHAGFEVTTAGTVAEALQLIASQKFQVLLADLNIGEPGDGFTVVSAMRRSQPDAVTLILTGYPAFETALEAIRQQVDDYLVKPAGPDTLINLIRTKLSGTRTRTAHIPTRRLPELIEELKDEIVATWLREVREDDELMAVRLSDAERTDHLPNFLDETARGALLPELSKNGKKAAVKHGVMRFRQGYTVPMVIREARILQNVIGRKMQEHLLSIQISYVIPDLIRLGATIEDLLEESIRAFLKQRPIEAAKGTDTSLLLLSGDPERAALRARILRDAGFHVVRPENRKEALRILAAQKFDVLVVSYTLSSQSILEFTEIFQQNNPNSPIISVTETKWQDLKVHMDFTVTGTEGPDALIDAVQAAVNRQQLRLVKA